MPIDPRDDPKDNRYIDKKKYPKTRKYMIGNTKIITHHPATPSREAVVNLFDTINEIAKQHEARGIDTSIQEKIDGIMPGILSIGVLFIYYYLISKKHVSVAKLVFFTIVIALLCAAIGLF